MLTRSHKLHASIVAKAVAASFVLIFGWNSAVADPIKDYMAALYVYFSGYGYLPIAPPHAGHPGDIYSTQPGRSFAYQYGECLVSLAPGEQPTALATSFDALRDSVQGELGVNLYKIFRLTTEAGARMSNEALFSFSDATILDVSEKQFSKSLAETDPKCIGKIHDNFNKESFPYPERAPWILQQVIYARIDTQLSFDQALDADAQAKVDTEITKYISDPSISEEAQHLANNSIRLSTKARFPVAYRPAYISLDDVKRLDRLDKEGFFSALLHALGLKESPLTELKRIQEKFPEALTRPNIMYKQMVTGRTIKFDRSVVDHLMYIERRDFLLAASWEMYREP